MSAARASLPKSVYPRVSLAAAALALGRRARVGLSGGARRWRVEVSPEGRGDAAALLGEFLNEALSHARRQALLKEVKPFAAVVVARLIEKGFPAAPADPLEQLEPQVRLDRAEETSALLDRARRQA
ncbi:MAG TPA: hypothetical protein VH309_01230 [Elusimicrobiota bacterium]|jgi:hypothetical protein|nr:hypothetical protein [Elusimicrobiota bacterium]